MNQRATIQRAIRDHDTTPSRFRPVLNKVIPSYDPTGITKTLAIALLLTMSAENAFAEDVHVGGSPLRLFKAPAGGAEPSNQEGPQSKEVKTTPEEPQPEPSELGTATPKSQSFTPGTRIRLFKAPD